jgi:hypothetical protein
MRKQSAIIEGIGKVKGMYNKQENWFEVWEGQNVGCYEMRFVRILPAETIEKRVKYNFEYRVESLTKNGNIKVTNTNIIASSLYEAEKIIEKRFPKQFDRQLLNSDNTF